MATLDRATSVAQTLQRLREKEVDAVELTRDALERAKRCKSDINAFSKLDTERALTAAAESDRRYREGRPRLLEGVPIAVKDMIDTAGCETRYGSQAFVGNIPTRDARVVEILRQSGAIILGKTTTHEFAWGVTTASEAFGDTKNPVDPSRVPGGSSGGMAAAIAYGAVSAGLGTDTGGSVRIPAALCGTVGFKPTYGRLSSQGVFPLSKSLDHPGILGATVADIEALAAAFGIVRGKLDGKLRIGVIEALPPVPTDKTVQASFIDATTKLGSLGRLEAITDTSIFEGLFDAFADTVLIEAGVHHSALHDQEFIKETYLRETSSRVALAQSKSVSDLTAARVRTWEFQSELELLFEDYDFLMMPTCPCVAPPRGVNEIQIDDWTGSERQALMAYTSPFNLAGVPAISIPIGGSQAERGLPTGLQIIAPSGDDEALLALSRAVERCVST
ncbi:amidase [Ruegeria sp.]|uniref:amidase n=1 Tax=Ruegeria sp. TaxID=1879320 RepID=UPI002618EFD8|nr:amidase [Ruegeria sp.]